jgi:hypothetical protein
MFIKKHPTKQTPLDAAIENAHDELVGHEAHTPEYSKIVDQLTKLYEIKAATEKQDRISKDTLAVIVGNLAGIAIIVGHERAHIVTSKALSFVGKFAR